MADRSFGPSDPDVSWKSTDRQWNELLWSLRQLVEDLDVESWPLRVLARSAASVTGLPRSSPGFGEHGMTRPAVKVDIDGNPIGVADALDLPPAHSDITGEQAVAHADGLYPDNHPKRDQYRMEDRAKKAHAFLEQALGICRAATAPPKPGLVREICPVCTTPKHVITKNGTDPGAWVISEGKCKVCVRRIVRNNPIGAKP